MKRWLPVFIALMLLTTLPFGAVAEDADLYIKEAFFEFDDSQADEYGVLYVTSDLSPGYPMSDIKAKIKIRNTNVKKINVLYNGENVTDKESIEVNRGECIYISPMVESGIKGISYSWDYGLYKKIDTNPVARIEVPEEPGEHLFSYEYADGKASNGEDWIRNYFIYVIVKDGKKETTPEQEALMSSPLYGYTPYEYGMTVPKNSRILLYLEERAEETDGFIYSWDRVDINSRESAPIYFGAQPNDEIDIPEEFEVGTEHKLYIEVFTKNSFFHWTQLFTMIVGEPI